MGQRGNGFQHRQQITDAGIAIRKRPVNLTPHRLHVIDLALLRLAQLRIVQAHPHRVPLRLGVFHNRIGVIAIKIIGEITKKIRTFAP